MANIQSNQSGVAEDNAETSSSSETDIRLDISKPQSC